MQYCPLFTNGYGVGSIGSYGYTKYLLYNGYGFGSICNNSVLRIYNNTNYTPRGMALVVLVISMEYEYAVVSTVQWVWNQYLQLLWSTNMQYCPLYTTGYDSRCVVNCYGVGPLNNAHRTPPAWVVDN